MEFKVEQGEVRLMFVVAVVLFLVWALAVVSATMMGGFVHVLLAGAIALAMARILQIRRAHQRLVPRS